ncbi:MAG: Trk family potassium uptake protein, partial [Oscillospiraceae bacterium]|nr:Trk family potassium uptake protein [Oscillospiraceae bacterium]
MAQSKDTAKKKFKMSNVQRLMLGFAVIILTGALLLCLPAASRDGRSTPFINSLFTATSATCVTGLITYDTYVHWTRFGQIVILLLIQTGGLGFMSFAAAAAMIAGKKIGLAQREMMQESVNGEQVGGIVKLFVMVLKGTFLCEGIGAALLSVRFIPEYGVGEGIFFSVFHS